MCLCSCFSGLALAKLMYFFVSGLSVIEVTFRTAEPSTPHHEETRELPEDRDNARNNVMCTRARKTMHGLDGQHQDVDRTSRGRVNQNDMDKWRKYVHDVANPRMDDG